MRMTMKKWSELSVSERIDYFSRFHSLIIKSGWTISAILDLLGNDRYPIGITEELTRTGEVVVTLWWNDTKIHSTHVTFLR